MQIDSPSRSEADGRIHVLSPELADQIAAGEVVERPASVVKELVENAIDAGATRVEVELRQAGLERIAVADDGCGIHPDDLELAVTRHATSKLRRPGDLVDIATLGFRGEALASMAAVADLTIESRTPDAKGGVRLRCRPGLPPERIPVGIPIGTRIVLTRLFGNLPARRKFMRSEATEVGHCTETMLRLGLVHPQVHLRLVHEQRELLELPAGRLDARVRTVLERRGRGPFVEALGEHRGIHVQAWLGSPAAAVRNRSAIYVVVRRRVVKERNLSQIVSASYGDQLAPGRHPVACLLVDPATGTVDVNVHPQKSEVRFSAPQDVYTAVRAVLDTAMAQTRAVTPSGSQAQMQRFGAAASTALLEWSQERAQLGTTNPPASEYTLRTRAASDGYATARDRLRAEAEDLRERWAEARAEERDPPPLSTDGARSPGGTSVPEPELLTCLPGPVALVREGDDVLAIDLPVLRSFLVYRRLQEDLGGGRIAAQGLLRPVVVQRSRREVRLWGEAGEQLEGLGLLAEPFGDDALIVRGVPAGLRGCMDEPDVADLVDRVVAWLRVRARGGADADPAKALQAVASTRGADPGPRLAKRWLRELRSAGVDLDGVPGIHRWTAAGLAGREESS